MFIGNTKNVLCFRTYVVEDDEFEYIDNVYRAGQEVKDKSMFIDRDLLIKRLSEDVKKDRINSIILYGQKRAELRGDIIHYKQLIATIKIFYLDYDISSIKPVIKSRNRFFNNGEAKVLVQYFSANV